jgi:hypothetical protein
MPQCFPEPRTLRADAQPEQVIDALSCRIWAMDARCGGRIDWCLSRLEGGGWAVDLRLPGGWRRWIGAEPSEVLEIALSAPWFGAGDLHGGGGAP